MQTLKLIGGAGTGKTRRLIDTLSKVLGRGVDPLDVGFVTFTRAARQEAVDRASDQLMIPPALLRNKGWFRTLHSVCYRLLGVDGELVTDDAKSRRWVADALGEEIDVVEGELEDTGRKTARTDAGRALAIWSATRNRLAPVAETYYERRAVDSTLPGLEWCKKIIGKYEEAKRAAERLDFTDLLLRVAGWRCWVEGVERTEPDGEPPDLEVWFHDEAQDVSKLSDAVFRRLIHRARTKWVYLAGDPFQAIYGFAGSHPRFLLDFPADRTEIMPHSWRCPAPILELGEQILRECDDYLDRHITPAEHPGEIVDRGLEHLAAEIDPREDWLVLARSNRLVAGLCHLLDEAGIPHRPRWQESRRTNAIRTLARLQSGDAVGAADFADVVAELKVAGRMHRGVKTYWKNLKANEFRMFPPLALVDVTGPYFTEEFATKVKAGRWTEDISGADTWLRAAEQWGEEAAARPGVYVGTIHSAKGAEADNVAVLTSLPYPTVRSLSVPELADAEQRVWYVAVTRTKRRLVVVSNPRERWRKTL